MSAVIRNEQGTYEVRRWSLHLWDYEYFDTRNDLWWMSENRQYASKFSTAMDAVSAIKGYRNFKKKPKDVKVWP